MVSDDFSKMGELLNSFSELPENLLTKIIPEIHPDHLKIFRRIFNVSSSIKVTKDYVKKWHLDIRALSHQKPWYGIHLAHSKGLFNLVDELYHRDFRDFLIKNENCLVSIMRRYGPEIAHPIIINNWKTDLSVYLIYKYLSDLQSIAISTNRIIDNSLLNYIKTKMDLGTIPSE